MLRLRNILIVILATGLHK